MENKEQFYKYAESLSIKINDAQRLMVLAKAVDENKEIEKSAVEKIQKMCEESLSPEIFEKWEDVKYWLIKNRKSLNKETTDIPTAEEVFNRISFLDKNGNYFNMDKTHVIEAMQEYATILLRKQAEVLSEKENKINEAINQLCKASVSGYPMEEILKRINDLAIIATQ